MNRAYENHPEVVARVAAGLQHRRESGIPEPELAAIAEQEGVWAYQIMDELGLSNQGGVFLPRPPRVVEPEPVTISTSGPTTITLPFATARSKPLSILAFDVESVEVVGNDFPPVRLARGESVTVEPVPVERPGDRVGKPTGSAWKLSVPGRTPTATPPVRTSVPKPPEATTSIWSSRLEAVLAKHESSAEIVVPLARMEALGWPASSRKYPTIWSTGNEAGRTARAMGWEPILRDGVGLVLRRRSS